MDNPRVNQYVVTGAARRGGAAIVRSLHEAGHRVIIHCRTSSQIEADILCHALNAQRAHSARLWIEDLCNHFLPPFFCTDIDGIVANASDFSPTHLDDYEDHLERDLGSHLYGHLRLIRQCRDSLMRRQGAIVAIGDIHFHRPAAGYLTYHIAKNALMAAMQALAVELAPQVRVNTVLPGHFDWPHKSQAFAEENQQRILQAVPLKRLGRFDELARAVRFLLCEATFTTGSFLTVDGGLSLHIEG